MQDILGLVGKCLGREKSEVGTHLVWKRLVVKCPVGKHPETVVQGILRLYWSILGL